MQYLTKTKVQQSEFESLPVRHGNCPASYHHCKTFKGSWALYITYVWYPFFYAYNPQDLSSVLVGSSGVYNNICIGDLTTLPPELTTTTTTTTIMTTNTTTTTTTITTTTLPPEKGLKNPCFFSHASCKNWKNISTDPPSTDCESGWSAFNGKCYKYFSEAKTWDNAQNYCRTDRVR